MSTLVSRTTCIGIDLTYLFAGGLFVRRNNSMCRASSRNASSFGSVPNQISHGSLRLVAIFQGISFIQTGVAFRTARLSSAASGV
jgi:hypothetical protein